jgi:hypothetical protein
MMSRVFSFLVGESELNALLSGKGASAGEAIPWELGKRLQRFSRGTVGVIAKQSASDDGFFQPLTLVVQEGEFRRLFGRVSQIRSELAPLSAWCHVLTPTRFAAIGELTREPMLGGYEAAWVALAVAHALLLSEIPVSKLKSAACFATETFAIARMKALWEPAPIPSIIERYDAVQRILRSRSSRNDRLRSALEPIWTCLAAVSSGDFTDLEEPLRPVANAVRVLYECRRAGRGAEEAARVALSLSDIPDAVVLRKLPHLTPEERVREFDHLVMSLKAIPEDRSGHRHILAFVAAYIATVAAGGAPSLSLLDSHTKSFPELLAWAYMLGSVGERVVWTSAFDGLGRLVARELMRAVHFDEPPSCDFSLDEAEVVTDDQLSDPFVHLRIKQSRSVSVALAPGVYIQVALAEPQLSAPSSAEVVSKRGRPAVIEPLNQPLDVLADQIWRKVRERVDERVEFMIRKEERKSARRGSGQEELPLKDPKEK